MYEIKKKKELIKKNKEKWLKWKKERKIERKKTLNLCEWKKYDNIKGMSDIKKRKK